MRLSIENYEIRKKLGEEKAIEAIRNAGFDCIDYSFYWLDGELKEKVFGEGYLEYAAYVKSILDKNGLVCNQAHAPFEMAYKDAFDISNQKYKELVCSLEFASVLGADNIIVHLISVPAGENLADYNYSFYKSLEPFCEKFRIHVSIENLFAYDDKRKHHIGRLGTPGELKAMIEGLNSEWFNICVDIGHSSITGSEPEDFIRGLDNKTLKALHVQDNDYLSDRHWLPYIGQLNWDNIMKALSGIGYEGDLTMEIFGYLRSFPAELMPSVLKLAADTGKNLISKL